MTTRDAIIPAPTDPNATATTATATAEVSPAIEQLDGTKPCECESTRRSNNGTSLSDAKRRKRNKNKKKNKQKKKKEKESESEGYDSEKRNHPRNARDSNFTRGNTNSFFPSHSSAPLVIDSNGNRSSNKTTLTGRRDLSSHRGCQHLSHGLFFLFFLFGFFFLFFTVLSRYDGNLTVLKLTKCLSDY